MTKLRSEYRAEKGEKIGGGFFVFRRTSTTGQVRITTNGASNKVYPFEHGSLDEAVSEAQRRAKKKPGTYSILHEVAKVIEQ